MPVDSNGIFLRGEYKITRIELDSSKLDPFYMIRLHMCWVENKNNLKPGSLGYYFYRDEPEFMHFYFCEHGHHDWALGDAGALKEIYGGTSIFKPEDYIK
jgi:hypothetical protein